LQATGKLSVKSVVDASFAAWGGLWTLCAGNTSPWNSHLGGEEYEPDAKPFELATTLYGNSSTALQKLDPDSFSSIINMLRYWGIYATEASNTSMDAVRAVFNPYAYGHTIEVSLKPGQGKDWATTRKWYTTGRVAKEMDYVMPDNKTVYVTDDGTNVGFFKFVADRAGDLSSGWLHAAKVTQVDAIAGGHFTISWIPLGWATQNELEVRPPFTNSPHSSGRPFSLFSRRAAAGA
jgi:secreted PhoX family phosphatase